MSLITLRSSQQTNGATVGESAALIRNYFKEGIELMPGNALELVSMSITKLDKFEIVQGQNDQFIWRIGTGPSTVGGVPNFSQHQVFIPAGSYNGAALAQTIAEATNSSTLLGNYRGQWTCVFTPSKIDGDNGTNAKFTLNYGQRGTPPSNGENVLYDSVGAGAISFTKDTPNKVVSVSWTVINPRDQGQSLIDNGIYGDRSIYANGGDITAIIKPLKDLTSVPDMVATDNLLTDYLTDIGSEDINVIITDFSNAQGWQYKMEFEEGDEGTIRIFKVPGTFGPVFQINLQSAGSGYAAGQVLNVISSNVPPGTGCTITINTVDPTDQGIATFVITTPGNGYEELENCILTGGSGADATCTIFGIEDGDGTGYAAGDTGTLVNKSGSLAGSGGTYTIGTVGAGGEVATLAIDDPGESYVAGDVLTLDATTGVGINATIKIITVRRGLVENFGVIRPDGLLGVGGNNGLSAADPASWGIGQMEWNTVSNYWQGIPGIGDELENSVLSKAGGLGYTGMVLENKLYPEGRFGRSRDQLIQGITEYPGNNNARINGGSDGQDISIYFTNTAELDDIQIRITGFVKNAGIDYPLPGWRTNKNFTDTVKSSNWNSLQNSPLAWTTFQYATDSIKIRISQYGIRNNRFFISHDSAASPGVFTNEVLLLQTLDVNSGVTFNSSIRERLYPYCPTAFISDGNKFDSAVYKIGGIYDDTRISSVPGLIGSTNSQGVLHNLSDDNESIEHENVNLGATLQQLSAMFKFGIVDQTDIFDGPSTGATVNQLSNRSENPNTANINFILGYETAYTFQSGKETNAVSTADTRNPETSLLEPSLHLELPDFNIKSFNGESGDTGRAVAVIPKEQWTTDSKTGTLQYVAPYPIPIDLRIPNYQVINEINARLRMPSGELANDLINPTEICLRLTETYESTQQRVMNNAINRMNSINSNVQDSKISNFNNGMPKI